MVIVLYEIGKILEARAINKTRKSISDLMDIKPEYANLKKGEQIVATNPENVKIGDIIIVKQGEKIPLDGIIIKGNSKINNSALTGESDLVSVKENDTVLSGGVNTGGILEIKVSKDYENSTVTKILNLVESATDRKAKTETFVSKAAKIYTPIVLILAILVAIFLPMIFSSITYSQSIYKALIFLVISCPCSIAISVPLSYFSGIGKASKEGILIKGSDYLDGLKDIKEIIFDKTGTLTTGNFTIKKVNVLNKNYTKDELIKYFAMGEKYSNHPIAKSIINSIDKNLKENLPEINNFEEIAGKGIKYEYQEAMYEIGNSLLIGLENTEDSKNNIYLQKDGEILGSLEIEDEIKKNTEKTIDKLNKLNISTKMFTGDKEEKAKDIAERIGIKEYKANMLPQDKYNELEKILDDNKTDKKIVYIGDGINDSPVLARSDIGISMGTIGSSSAIEASDVVIMTDEINKVLDAIKIAKKTDKIIKQNLIFAIGVKILIMILSIFGIADMWQAVFADVGTTLITILNTLRILK